MKRLPLQGTLLLILLGFTATCQVNIPLNQHPIEKTPLFNQLPEKLVCPAAVLENIFSQKPDSRLNAKLSSQFSIEGIVVEKTLVTAQQLSINIRCTNFQNALFNISRITQQDGSFRYIGRIVSPAHGDVLLLQEEKGEYSFIKQKQLLSMVE
jgi:hypothetical protein